MKRKILVTFAMSTLFVASQLAFLPVASAHAAPDPHLYASSHVLTVRGGNLEALLSHKKTLTLKNSKGLSGHSKNVNFSKGLSNIEALEKLLSTGI